MAERPALPDALKRLPARLAAVPLLVYRYGISPVIGPRCRFHPSCSEYGLEALHRFGLARGAWLVGARLVCCHPWHPGGVDPLPESFDDAAPSRYLGRVLRAGTLRRADADATLPRDAASPGPSPAAAPASPSSRS
ncbi:MAG: membrane protein insertion efficiency factor YidD [Burkholderiales bacterium]|jgi:putative membrane protein insertion efficiency factor|nr:membrane protein insertion efficiency factor YidD [Burkholderiales bacterium]